MAQPMLCTLCHSLTLNRNNNILNRVSPAPRWRGVDQKVQEDVNRFTLSLRATPFNWIGVNYEMTVEKYDREFNNASLDVIAQKANVPVVPFSTPATNTGPESFINLHNTEFWPLEQVSLGWVPSTIKFSTSSSSTNRLAAAC
jgi:hypothetical protein